MRLKKLMLGKKVGISIRNYELTNKGDFEKDFDLKRQIRRASVSISSNIAEGFERNTNREFVHFLCISKTTAGAVRSQLYLALDLGCLEKEEFIVLKEKIENIFKMLSGFIKYLDNWTKHFLTFNI